MASPIFSRNRMCRLSLFSSSPTSPYFPPEMSPSIALTMPAISFSFASSMRPATAEISSASLLPTASSSSS